MTYDDHSVLKGSEGEVRSILPKSMVANLKHEGTSTLH
jgi:hypothetical protein